MSDDAGHEREKEKARELLAALRDDARPRRLVDRELYLHANAVPGFWVGIDTGPHTLWAVATPQERARTGVPWAVPGGLSLFTRDALEDLLRDVWIDHACAWLASTD